MKAKHQIKLQLSFQVVSEKPQPFSILTTEIADAQSTPAPTLNNINKAGLLEILLQAEHTSGFIPYALTEKGKKKKKSKSQRL